MADTLPFAVADALARMLQERDEARARVVTLETALANASRTISELLLKHAVALQEVERVGLELDAALAQLARLETARTY